MQGSTVMLGEESTVAIVNSSSGVAGGGITLSSATSLHVSENAQIVIFNSSVAGSGGCMQLEAGAVLVDQGGQWLFAGCKAGDMGGAIAVRASSIAAKHVHRSSWVLLNSTQIKTSFASSNAVDIGGGAISSPAQAHIVFASNVQPVQLHCGIHVQRIMSAGSKGWADVPSAFIGAMLTASDYPSAVCNLTLCVPCWGRLSLLIMQEVVE